MPITATGIGSGLDVEGLVAQLVLADVQPTEQRLNTSEAKYQSEVSAYGLVKSALSTFQSIVNTSAQAAQYTAKNAGTSLFSAVTATAEEVAEPGTYALEVSSLAKTQYLASSAFSATTDTLGTGTLSISVGTTNYNAGTDVYTSFVQKSGTTAVNITIDSSNNTVSGVRDAINAANAGVSASIVNDGSGYRLVLQSSSTGADNSLSISVADTGDSNNTDAAGLSRLAFNASATNLSQSQGAQNAQLTINGLTVSSASNTLSSAIDGVTFSLKDVTTSPVTITVSKDTAKAKEAVQALVDGFNELMSVVTPLTSFDASTSKGSLLTGDSTLRNLEETLRASLSSAVANSGGNYSTLAELGITTNVIDGTLSLNTTTLDKILTSDEKDVAKVLAQFATPTNENVQFVSGTSATEAGTYAVQGTTTNTAGFLTAGNAVSNTSYNGNGNNATFSISIDGGTAVEITLSNNESSTTAVLDRINAALSGAGAVAALANDTLTFTSATSGTSSSIEITAADSNAVNGLGISVGAGTAGTSSTSYTINGAAVTQVDNVITGAIGTAVEGLSLKVLGNATGNLGTVGYTLGVAGPLNSLITNLLADEGLLDARLDGLAKSITDITEQRSALELRSQTLERRYRNQFNGLETLISQLNTTQSFLNTALKQFVEPLDFKK